MDTRASQKAKHKLKRKANRKLMKRLGVNSPAWDAHKKGIRKRVLKVEAIAHARSLERKEAKKKTV